MQSTSIRAILNTPSHKEHTVETTAKNTKTLMTHN